jgi:hypothetical protein
MNDWMRLTLADWLVLLIGAGVVFDLVVTIPLAIWMGTHYKLGKQIKPEAAKRAERMRLMERMQQGRSDW